MSYGKIAVLLFFLLATMSLSISAPAFATSEEEKSFLNMWFTEEELMVVSTTRSLRSITRVAENVEVVTKEDIELMNAHTLADVLNIINGVEVAFSGASPGSIASAQIEASRNDNVVVLIDGINFNYLGSGVADVSLIPAQIIEKVEVIKGPASSAWGSSLGGIINVITKSPGNSNAMNGLLQGSYGQSDTGDFRGELSGRKDKFGYYLFAGRLETDGLRTWEDLWQDNLYAKFSYDFTKDTAATFTLLYNKGRRTEGDLAPLDLKASDKTWNLLSSLSLRSQLSDTLSLNVSARAANMSLDDFLNEPPTAPTSTSTFDDRKYGGSVKLDWEQGVHNVVVGSDYDFWQTSSNALVGGPVDEQVIAIYANDTISLGRLSVVPGLRYDNIDINNNGFVNMATLETNFNEHFISPSLGITYEIGKKILLRGFVARGFSVPKIGFIAPYSPESGNQFFQTNPNLTAEKVWSYQIGSETEVLKYLWLKVAGFRNEIQDAIEPEDIGVDANGNILWTFVNKGKVRRQGFEIEIKTLPFYNFTLFAATTYINTKDLETGETIKDNPEYTYDVGLQYDDKKSFRALLKGHYIWWNASFSSPFMAKYNGFIFDINMIKSFYKKRSYAMEAFFNAHNIFDGSQYWVSVYKNAARWVEGGIRIRF